jgi:ABC-type sugar transport system permease subunit
VTVEHITCRNIRRNWVVFLMLVPTLAGVGIFSYGPALEAIRHSFYNWDGAFTEEFVGLKNFRGLLGDLTLWAPLLLGGLCFFIGGGAGMGPRKRRLLRAVGGTSWALAATLMLLDARLAMSPRELESLRLTPGQFTPLLPLALGFLAALALARTGESRWAPTGNVAAHVLPFVMGLVYLAGIRKTGDWLFWKSFNLIFILIVANLLKMWPSIFAAVCIHRLRSERWQYVYRVLFVIPMIIPHMVGLLIWKFFYDPNVGVLNWLLTATGADRVLIWLDRWVLHLGIFVEPFKPAWLGHPDLIIPALLFWGFPWVGVVGVLIYLSGLQNISQDVYEAAEIDGIGSWGKFTRIELPLIMTQVRLNLVLMVIGTLQAYGFQLILLGPEGGPQNKGLTPGLYMFYESFQNQNYGYACAIGLMLFFIILFLTVLNQRYVRVEK